MTSRRHDDAARAIARLQRALGDYALKGHSHSIPDVLPKGVLGYAERTSNQTGITGVEVIGGLSVTVDVTANRRIKVTAYVRGTTSTVATDRAALFIREDGSDVQNQVKRFGGTDLEDGLMAVWIGTPSAGSRTYDVQYQRIGTGTHTVHAAADGPAFILVEDIGPA